ncbi:hypothetical protein B0H11DRAFT_2201844 [Mycena galericulata]|nr:hypothetical protein B0H11DRAFT_2201844 [Mycena galericulata]
MDAGRLGRGAAAPKEPWLMTEDGAGEGSTAADFPKGVGMAEQNEGASAEMSEDGAHWGCGSLRSAGTSRVAEDDPRSGTETAWSSKARSRVTVKQGKSAEQMGEEGEKIPGGVAGATEQFSGADEMIQMFWRRTSQTSVARAFSRRRHTEHGGGAGCGEGSMQERSQNVAPKTRRRWGMYLLIGNGDEIFNFERATAGSMQLGVFFEGRERLIRSSPNNGGRVPEFWERGRGDDSDRPGLPRG